MANILPPISSTHLPVPRASPPLRPHAPSKFSTRATDSDNASEPESSSAGGNNDDDFDARLNRVRYRSGVGKKAELRRTRKSKSKSTSGSPSGSVYLPPIPLKEPVSAFGGVNVEFGFSPYSERVNGVAAGLGLAGLLAVELATGKSLVGFHTPSVLLVQVYFVAAATAVFIKFEKERRSVWPAPQQQVRPPLND